MGKKKKKKPAGLGSVTTWKNNINTEGKLDRKKLVFIAGASVVGVVLGVALGNNRRNLLVSAVATATGVYFKNAYLTAAGASMFISAHASKDSSVASNSGTNSGTGMSGLDFVSGAKVRMGDFFNAFKEKFQLADPVKKVQTTETVEGFGSVYSNPLALQQGMNQLNEIERQLEQMNGTDSEEISDLPDREM